MNTISGYTEIKLPDGTIVPLKYGMWTFRELCRRWGVTMAGIQGEVKKRMTEDPFSGLFDILSIAAEYASRAAGQPKTFDDVEVSQWIDNTGGFANSPVMNQALQAFGDAMGVDLTTGNAPEEVNGDAKKN